MEERMQELAYDFSLNIYSHRRVNTIVLLFSQVLHLVG
jgi:hypothetical protein